MAKIKTADIRFLEGIFSEPRRPGYLFDLTDRSFTSFFKDEIGVDIDHQKYCQEGSSKGKKLRTFLKTESDQIAGKSLRALWEYGETIRGIGSNEQKVVQNNERFFLDSARFGWKGIPQASPTKENSTRIDRSLSPSSGRT